MTDIDICPTITAADQLTYDRQLNRVIEFSGRLHIDLADGQFALSKLIDISQLWWPANVTVDLHLMYRQPLLYANLVITQKPQLVIVHAESEGNFFNFAQMMHQHGIEVGVALLAATSVDVIKSALGNIDHVLIFSGNLGFQGNSHADLRLLKKAKDLRALKPKLEIGWDGGVNDQNIGYIAEAGVDVVNVGSFIQAADNPRRAYVKLKTIIQKGIY